MRIGIVVCCLLTLQTSCGDVDHDPSSSSGGTPEDTGGRTSAMGGTTSVGATGGANASGGAHATGGSSLGGTSMGGSSLGGSKSTGGAAATGGQSGTPSGGSGGHGGTTNGGASNGGASNAPKGDVESCLGEVCPLGECDNSLFFADVECSKTYPGPVNASSDFCVDDGGYCLVVITDQVERWVVRCASDEPTIGHCGAGQGCVVVGTKASCN